MKQDVILKITGFVTGEDGSTDKNVTEENASYYLKNGSHHVILEDEMSAKSARYKLNHRGLEVIKNGDISAKMVFEAGRSFTSMYRTPYGKMPLTFVTKQYALFEESSEIRAEITYSVKNGENRISDNRIELRITEKAI